MIEAGRIEVGRDKADLKAVRESIGVNQIDLANMLRVTVRTIKRWEQIGWEEPPAEVWDLLEELVEDHEREVDVMVRQAEEAVREKDAGSAGSAVENGGDAGDGDHTEDSAAPAQPKTIYLAYYKNQDHYDCFPHPRGAQHAWGNAVSRRAADILRFKGYRVFFYYPETSRGHVDED